ncbi:hypothetical protein RCL1_004307 [Eukaryota sp. TZLM3-RCL]
MSSQSGILSHLKVAVCIDDEEREDHAYDLLASMGSRVRALNPKSSVLVFDSHLDSDKLKAVEYQIPVVTLNWLTDCHEANMCLDFTKYLLTEAATATSSTSNVETLSQLDSSMFATQQDLVSNCMISNSCLISANPECPPAPKKEIPTSTEERQRLARDALPPSQVCHSNSLENYKPTKPDFTADSDDDLFTNLQHGASDTDKEIPAVKMVAKPVKHDPFAFEKAKEQVKEDKKSVEKSEESEPVPLAKPLRKTFKSPVVKLLHKPTTKTEPEAKKPKKVQILSDDEKEEEKEVKKEKSPKQKKECVKKVATTKTSEAAKSGTTPKSKTNPTVTPPKQRLKKGADEETPKSTEKTSRKRKASDDKPKTKKPRINDDESEEENLPLPSLEDTSDDDCQVLSTTTISGQRKIGFSSLTRNQKNDLYKLRTNVGKYEIEIVDTNDASEIEGVDVLVHGGDRRTPKLCFAIVCGSFVVSPAWVTACLEANEIVDPEPFELTEFPGCKAGRKFFELLSEQKANGQPLTPHLFDNLIFVVDKNTELKHTLLARLIKACQPKKILSLTRQLPSEPIDYTVVSSKATSVPNHARGVIVSETWIYDVISNFKYEAPKGELVLGNRNKFSTTEASPMEN